jgi:ABC-type protease/lipase transport system fused ATPase/permease subunit
MPLAHVLIASLFVYLFALVTPLFFQIVIEKVLARRGMSTLVVIVVGSQPSACSMSRCNIYDSKRSATPPAALTWS